MFSEKNDRAFTLCRFVCLCANDFLVHNFPRTCPYVKDSVSGKCQNQHIPHAYLINFPYKTIVNLNIPHGFTILAFPDWWTTIFSISS